ncbi:MAG TPA: hypothetical protein VMZ53_04610 [Kofleriaceae bacterium]|nr:hypothetical protein [Kofleriaceae bacterium]
MQLASMVDVVARCIAKKDAPRTRLVAKSIDGVIAAFPTVGSSLVIYRRGRSHRLVTSSVVRVLRDVDGATVYVETRNSVYRVTLRAAL